jgi:ATP-binding cassette subfamily B protein
MNVEQIVVFDKGEISETGRHEGLVKKRGIYANLWRNFEKAQNWDLHHKGDI